VVLVAVVVLEASVAQVALVELVEVLSRECRKSPSCGPV
jgi:hypothetical protein